MYSDEINPDRSLVSRFNYKSQATEVTGMYCK